MSIQTKFNASQYKEIIGFMKGTGLIKDQSQKLTELLEKYR